MSKRVYDGKLPLVLERHDGRRSVEIAKGVRVVWWDQDDKHCTVRIEVDDDAEFRLDERDDAVTRALATRQ